MSNHSNISIFVPHNGCPHQCSFCNQRYITKQSYSPTAKDVDEAVNIAINSARYDKSNGQIAFFGGSFTAIERNYMIELLSAAKRRIDLGDAESIRISTRPDCINSEILDLLKKYGVRSIELGAQSMNDDVLRLNERGHDSKAVENASRLIKENGFELGLQMMTGLYGDNDDNAIHTAKKFIELYADTVRIYPTIVLDNTRLCEIYKSGNYRPQTVDEAVDLGAKLCEMFYNADIPVIRFGLHTIDEEHYVAGPWHPALAELVYSKMYLNKALSELKNQPFGRYILCVSPKSVSKMSGQHKCNLEKLRKMGYNCKIGQDESIAPYQVKIKREE